MSTIVRHSDIWPSASSGLPAEGQASARDAAPIHEPAPTIWLDGDVIGCACPDCGAPMSVRLWLRLADCWQCGTSLELTEAQEREVERLLAERDRQCDLAADDNATELLPAVAPLTVSSPAPSEQILRASEIDVRDPPRQTIIAPPVARADANPAPRTWSSLVAWIASLLAHMLLIILLGLWMLSTPVDDRPISLTSGFGLLEVEGDQTPLEEVSIPLEQPDSGDVQPAVVEDDPFRQREAPVEILTERPAGDEPALVELPQELLTPSGPGSSLRGRGTRERAELVKSEGGNRYSEEAVARGLRWLAMHQHDDGRWGLHDFDRCDKCRGRCGNQGQRGDTAATALALLPFLGAGQTHRGGDYRQAVDRGLRWIVAAQRGDGDLRGRGIGQMYAHALCTIVLCEAYALTHDPELRAPAQLGVDFIVAAQHHGGGWRYRPGEAGDTSVVGWQMMALRSAEMAYLDVPDKTFRRIERYLEKAQSDKVGGLYGYQPGFDATPAMTAEGLLCRQYSGWTPEHPGMKKGVGNLLDRLPDASETRIYYWYYATQVMHHHGGEAWQAWNEAMRDTLIELQETHGHEAGSWSPGNDHMATGGRLAATSLSICTLEVYYRHLPLYRQQAAQR